MEFTVFATLPALDMDRARAWYKDKLGLEPVETGQDGSSWFQTGSTYFLIYPSQFAGGNRTTAAGFVVDDFDEAAEELRAKRILFEDYDFGDDFNTVDGILEGPDGSKAAWFKDSEGNILSLASRQAATATD